MRNFFRLDRFLQLVSLPSHSRTLSFLALLILVAAIPLTVFIAQKQQELRQRAAYESCGDGHCDEGESCENCIPDCGACFMSHCGDTICSGESCETCSADCGPCSNVHCGDNSCNGDETCENCITDCGPCDNVHCGDTSCNDHEDCNNCEWDCGPCDAAPTDTPEPPTSPPSARCGDNSCNGQEDCANCTEDCGACDAPTFCGDTSCNGAEDCNNCEWDCGSCSASTFCGNSHCDGSENCQTCDWDCGPCNAPTNTPAPTPDRGGGTVCLADSYKTECTDRCGGCPANEGEQEVWQCKSDGSGWKNSYGACDLGCAGPCQGAVTPTPTPRPGGAGGCCSGGPGQGTCRSWERCDIANGSCATTGTGSAWSCRSTEGCARDSDCGPENHCENARCMPGPPTGRCRSASSLQTRFQSPNISWTSELTVAVGTTVNAAVFRNGTGEFAGASVNGEYTPDDVDANISGPTGTLGINVGGSNRFTPSQPGTYTLEASCGNNQRDTATLTVTGTLTPTPSVAPTSAPGDTLLSFTLALGGIGSGGNPNPVHTQKQFTVQLFNSSNTQVGSNRTGPLNFDSGSGTFKGTINLGGGITTGDYNIKIKENKYLRRRIPQIIHITGGTTNQISPATLIVGDVNNDNKLDILDYNILVSCYGAGIPSCGNNRDTSDLDDNGRVDGPDYNLFIRSLSEQQGD